MTSTARVLIGAAALGVTAAVVGLVRGASIGAPRPVPGTVRPAPLQAPPPLDDPRAAIGRAIFFDRSLSTPPGTSCADCHDPARGYSGNHGSANGLARGSRPGRFARRSTPSVLYLRFIRRFHMTWDDESNLPEASGGFFWDGRESSVARLVLQPLLNPDEMGNPSREEIAGKLATAAYAPDLRRAFDAPFASLARTIDALGLCLEAFLTSREMAPFSSRFDDFVRGTGTLTPLEQHGLALFEDAEKGGCRGCHRMDRGSVLPESSLFTDYGYEVVGVPRNRRRPPPRGRQYDLGICERRDARLHTDDRWFCGSFRTPSLRNVALRESFMHNGTFTSLRDVVAFYATRGADPARWYGATPFDDLPPRYRTNVDAARPPYDQPPGGKPRLDDAEIDAIVAFLGTLTDRNLPPPSL